MVEKAVLLYDEVARRQTSPKGAEPSASMRSPENALQACVSVERLRHPGHQGLNALDVGQNHGKPVIKVHDDTWETITLAIDPPVGRGCSGADGRPQFPSLSDAVSHPLLVGHSPPRE